jgi:hypothetical protein
MAHSKIIQAIRVYLDDIIDEHTELGVYSLDSPGGSVNEGSPIIELGAGEGYKYHIGQRVKVADGFPSATDFYFVIATSADTITLNVNATATRVNQHITSESEIRWSENELSGTILSWKSGIIARNGIGVTKEGADLSAGGAPAFFDGFSVMAINTNQLILRLKELGIKLPGLTCEKYEFVGTEADSDATEEKKLFTGAIEDLTWDETILEISIKNNSYKCRALMGTVINNCPVATGGNYPDAADSLNGQIVPMTYGKLLPDAEDSSENILAKFIRTGEKQETMTNSADGSNYCDPNGATIFPVVGYGDTAANSHLAYKIQFGTAVHGISGYPLSFDMSEKYVKIVVGGSADSTSMVGKYRKIVKHIETTGDATLGSAVITNIPDTSDIVIGTKLYIPDGFTTKIFDLTVLSKTADTVTVDQTADATATSNIYQGYCMIGLGGSAYIVLDSFFEKDLSGNSDATAVNNAWAQIIDIPFEFQCDVWPCKGFLDETGASIIQEPHLYTYSDKVSAKFKTKFRLESGVYVPFNEAIPEGFLQLPKYGYNIVSDSPYTKLIIDIKLFNNDPSKLSSYSIFPCKTWEKYIKADLSEFGITDRVSVDAAKNVYSLNIGPAVTFDVYSEGSDENQFDKDDSITHAISIHTHAVTPHEQWLVWDFELPIDKLTIEYVSFYLGIRMRTQRNITTNATQKLTELRLYWRRFMGFDLVGNANEINTAFIGLGQVYERENDDWHIVDDLPDFYYLTRTPGNVDNNKAFYFEETPTTEFIRNHLNFKLNGFNNVDALKSIHKMTLMKASGSNVDVNVHQEINLDELALICEREMDVGSELYSIFSGRVYNDTWGGRVTATDMIQDPIAMIEEACRKQNWSGVGDLRRYGKEYCPNAKIKLTGNGSFDDTGLTSIKALRPAFQILDLAKSWTDKFKEALCRRYFLLTRQDEDGYECVHYLDPQNTDETVPATVITMADIIGDVGETVEPKGSDVFVEPFLNYAYNSGSEKFDKQLRIFNAPDAAWVGTGTEASPQYAAGSGWHAEYTPGFQGTDGQDVWLSCHALWNKFRTMESPPSDKTDAREIVLYSDALHNIKEWVAWMGKRRDSFTVPYTLAPSGGVKARDWYPGMKFLLNLLHRTNAFNAKYLIEKIEKDKNAGECGTVKVNVILLVDIPTAFFLA